MMLQITVVAHVFYELENARVLVGQAPFDDL